MREITRASVQAFKNAKNFKLSNTEVINKDNNTTFYLFDNLIALKTPNNLILKDAGRKTKTTKDRLNAILWEFWLGYIYQKGKDAENKKAWFYVDQRGNEEKREGQKTLKLN